MPHFHIRPRFVLSLQTMMAILAFVWLASVSSPAQAELVFGLIENKAVTGSSTNSFDVTVTNTGPDVSIAGFSFEISAGSSDLTFTSVTDDTNQFTGGVDYVFENHSLFGPDITLNVSNGGQTISASDNYDTPNTDRTLASGQTLGLGLVNFSLSSGASLNPITITFTTGPISNINNSSGSTYTPTLPSHSEIQPVTQGNTVPEPSTITSMAVGILGLFLIRKRPRSATLPSC